MEKIALLNSDVFIKMLNRQGVDSLTSENLIVDNVFLYFDFCEEIRVLSDKKEQLFSLFKRITSQNSSSVFFIFFDKGQLILRPINKSA